MTETQRREQIIKRTLVRDLPNHDRVIAHLECRVAADGERFTRGLSPSFSLTGELYEHRANASGATRHRQGREPEQSGAMGDMLAHWFPDLARFNAVHLSDPITGEPMHAEANGWYFYAGSRADLRGRERFTGFEGIYAWRLAERGLTDDDAGREEYCRQLACSILRVSEIPAFPEPEPSHEIGPRRGGPAYESRRDYTRRKFGEFVNEQRERWAREAAEMREYIESLPES